MPRRFARPRRQSLMDAIPSPCETVKRRKEEDAHDEPRGPVLHGAGRYAPRICDPRPGPAARENRDLADAPRAGLGEPRLAPFDRSAQRAPHVAALRRARLWPL